MLCDEELKPFALREPKNLFSSIIDFSENVAREQSEINGTPLEFEHVMFVGELIDYLFDWCKNRAAIINAKHFKEKDGDR